MGTLAKRALMNQPRRRPVPRSAVSACLSLLIGSAPALAWANLPGGGTDTGPDVSLINSGSTVVLDNGTVRATIMKNNARVISLLYNGYQMLATDRQIYFSMDEIGRASCRERV